MSFSDRVYEIGMLALPPSQDSVGESAYRRIRINIVFARLRPGERLKLDRLRTDYGVSIGTLRELLNRLVSEGLIVAEGQKGFSVAGVSAREFRELADMRLLLEGHAMAQSFAVGDMEWEGRVVAAHHKLAQMERRMLGGEQVDPELWKRYDWEFHHALLSACGSQVLLDSHAAIFDRYLRYQMVAVIFRGGVAAGEHEVLRDCALRRDTPHAVATLTTHINACVEHTLKAGTL